MEQYGIHTATSRSGYGTSPPLLEVERRAAKLLGAEDAIYLVSGYAGNTAVAAALAGTVDRVLVDEHAHDSLAESARGLGASVPAPIAFRHRDVEHLGELIRQSAAAGTRPLVLTDGIFAVSGHIAPLTRVSGIAGRHRRRRAAGR